jgi:hypothetical protein
LTNKVISLENESTTEDTLEASIRIANEVELQKKKEVIKQKSPPKEEPKVRREQSLPDHLKQQRSVFDFFLKGSEGAEPSQQIQALKSNIAGRVSTICCTK